MDLCTLADQQLRHGDPVGSGVLLQEIRLGHLRFQPGQQIIPEGLVILQELPVIRHRIPVCGHVGGKAGQIPEQVEGLGVKQGCLQEHGQIGVILLS